jgi:SOS-response transcriptional repressor LexA
MSIHKLIREGRARLALTEEAFAKLCGVTRATVQQWEREGGTAPARKRQQSVADVLGISVAQLMTGDGSTNTAPGPNIRGEVPLISSVQAGSFTEHVDNFHPGDGGMEMISTSVPVNRYTFALRVTGDSMEPEFTEGMVLIIEPELDPLPGDFVIAKNGGDETTFKQLVKDGTEWYLKPLNPRYPIKALGDSRIIGVLRSVEKRYR